jgi:hypothetical protein
MIDYRMRSNLRRINLALRRKQRLHGQTVKWYVYTGNVANDDGLDTDTYDEGLNYTRTWDGGTDLAVVQAYYVQAGQGDTEDGLYLVDSLRLTIAAETFRNSLGVELLDPRHHMHDRFSYEGNVFSVSNFELLGRVADLYTIVSVLGTEVTSDEDTFDVVSPVVP